jgi:hypothetical protein
MSISPKSYFAIQCRCTRICATILSLVLILLITFALAKMARTSFHDAHLKQVEADIRQSGWCSPEKTASVIEPLRSQVRRFRTHGWCLIFVDTVVVSVAVLAVLLLNKR